MRRTRSQKAKNITLLRLGIPSNISFFQSFTVTLSIYFTESSHIFRLHNCRLRGEPEPGSHVSLESREGGGELDWQLTNWGQNKDRGFIQDTAGFLRTHLLFLVFPSSQRKTLWLFSLCFVLFFLQTVLSAQSGSYNEYEVLGKTAFDKCKQYA